MVNPGPDEPTRGSEYPPLEDAPAPADPYAPVDYPSDTGTTPNPPTPPGYAQPDYPQPVYQQPGYPEFGYQQPGYPPPPAGYLQQYATGGYPYAQNPYAQDPYAPARPTGTNGKAIAALVTSLAGIVFCGLPSFVGVVLGVMAMRETKRTGQEGYGLALAGVIVGAIVTVLSVLVVIAYVVGIAAVMSSPTSF